MNRELQVIRVEPSRYRAAPPYDESGHLHYSSLRGVEAAQVRQYQSERLKAMAEYAETNGDLLFYAADDGVKLQGGMILYFGSDDDITGTPHAFILDLHGTDQNAVSALIEKAGSAAAEASMGYLAVDVSIWDKKLRNIITSNGFVDEYSVFIHTLKRDFPRFEGERRFLIRAAEMDNIDDMLAIGRESIDSLISPYRLSTQEDALRHYEECYSNLHVWLHMRERFAAFIANERESMEPSGIILLHLGGELPGLEEPFFRCSTRDSVTGQQQVSLLLLSVRKRYHGKYVGQSLISHASRDIAGRGFTMMAGEILTANLRALATLLRRFKGPLEVEKTQMVKRIDLSQTMIMQS
jgi:hypothetical protein